MSFASDPRPLLSFGSDCAPPQCTPFHVHVLPEGLSAPHLRAVTSLAVALHRSPSWSLSPPWAMGHCRHSVRSSCGMSPAVSGMVFCTRISILGATSSPLRPISYPVGVGVLSVASSVSASICSSAAASVSLSSVGLGWAEWPPFRRHFRP